METSILKNIKGCLSGKDAIKITPKGVRYRFFHVKRKVGGKFNGRGTSMFFSDYGTKASFTNLKYDFSPQTKSFSVSSETKIWFSLKNGRLIVSESRISNGNPCHRIISNRPSKINFSIAGSSQVNKKRSSSEAGNKYLPERRFRTIFIQWLRKNNFTISRKQQKYTLSELILSVAYPEIQYFLDVKSPTHNAVSGINTEISSNLRGIRGFNFGLNRLIGFHGKKLKKILMNADNIFDAINFARLFKGLVTNDDIIKLLETRYRPLSNFEYKQFRYFLKNYGRDTIMNWMETSSDRLTSHLITDTVFQYYRHNIIDKNQPLLQLPNTNNLEEIHDIITGNVRRIAVARFQTQEMEDADGMDYTEANKEFSNLEFENEMFSVKLPKKGSELVQASCDLSNCLSGYTHSHGRDTIILLVYTRETQKIKYAISINKTDMAMKQFYGKYNTFPESSDYSTICEFLKTQNIDTGYFDVIFQRHLNSNDVLINV